MEIAEMAGSEQQKEASVMTLKALNDLTLAVKGLRSTQDKMITKVAKIDAQNRQVAVYRGDLQKSPGEKGFFSKKRPAS